MNTCALTTLMSLSVCNKANKGTVLAIMYVSQMWNRDNTEKDVHLITLNNLIILVCFLFRLCRGVTVQVFGSGACSQMKNTLVTGDHLNEGTFFK